MQIQSPRRSGKVAVLVALCLTVVMGFTALAIDGGLVLDQQRRAQSAVDAAALAAAEDLFANYRTNGGDDPNGTAESKAAAVTRTNGFSAPAVNIPPLSGPFAGQYGYAEVVVTWTQKRAFSRIWGSSNLTGTVRATGQGKWVAIKAGIILLDPDDRGALTATGNGKVTVAGCPIIINSSDPAAAVAVGNAKCIAPEFDIVGNPGVSGSGNFIGTVVPNSTPVPDPLKYLPPPDPASLTLRATTATRINDKNTVHLQPGVYRGGISITGQGKVVLASGIYYMDGGGFSITGQGGLDAAGVLIYNDPSGPNDDIQLAGQGDMNISPLTSGIYQGISLWQDRTATNRVQITGNGSSTMTGTFYAAAAELKVAGNGTTEVIGSQYISNTLTVHGNGEFKVNWVANQTARTRLINLVE